MRQLIFMWRAIFVFSCSVAMGAFQEVEINVEATNQTIKKVKSNSYLSGDSDQKSIELKHTGYGWPGNISSRVAIKNVKKDPQRIYIENAVGEKVPLATVTNQKDYYSGQLSVIKAISNIELLLRGNSSLGDDSFFTKGYGGEAIITLRERGSRINFGADFEDAHRPLAYYSHPADMISGLARPQRVQRKSLLLGVEQIVMEKNKVGIDLGFTAANAERPPLITTNLAYGLVLTETLYLQTSLGSMREERHEHLKNERGYFTLYSTAIRTIWEPHYDVFFDTEIAYLYEKEYDPRLFERTILISRQLGLGIRYERSRPVYKLGVTMAYLSNRESLWGIEGGVAWKF